MKESILKRFPDLTEEDVFLQDDGDGPYIAKWNSIQPKPTMDQVNQWVAEDAKESKPLTDVEQLQKDQADLILQLVMKGVL